MKMSKKLEKWLYRNLIAFGFYLILLGIGHFLPKMPYKNLAMFFGYLVLYFFVGFRVLQNAWKKICSGQIFDENFLMMIATVGAFAIGEYSEGVAVMLFYQIGEWFQSYAVGKSRQSITAMMEICPEYANVKNEQGVLEEIEPEEVEKGTIITVLPGERIPIDGIVIKGNSYLDTAALTGEPIPVYVKEGSEVYSGCINQEQVLEIRTTRLFEDSTVAKILELVETAGERKARLENFITRFAKYYTPIVTIGAVILGVGVPLVLGETFAKWLMRACIFLVLSCPCALVISVPLGFFGGIGAASKRGVLIKGSNYLEAIANMDTLVFDKTGTLTTGKFQVQKVISMDGVKENALQIAAIAENYSNHPIGISICEAYGKNNIHTQPEQLKEIPGRGILAKINGKDYTIGNQKWMQEKGVTIPNNLETGTQIYVAKDTQLLGIIIIGDEIKEDGKALVEVLKNHGIKNLVILTGDGEEPARRVGEILGIERVYSGLMPKDKLDILEQIQKEEKRRYVGFVGDGMNDAPVLIRSDVGFAMGSMGSDAAIEAADVVLMDDRLGKLSDVIQISRKTLWIVKENIVFALGVKIIVLILGALGMANMWEAVFADVGVAVLAILNSMRALSYKEK